MAQAVGFDADIVTGDRGRRSDFDARADEDSKSDSVTVVLKPSNLGRNNMIGCVTDRSGRGIFIRLIGDSKGKPNKYCLDRARNQLFPSNGPCR